METWLKVIVTALTIAGFALTLLGAWRLLSGARAGVRRMEGERATRDRLRRELKAAPEGTTGGTNPVEEWREGHRRAGLEPYDIAAVNDGREFLAERIIRELETSSRGDVALVVIGVVLGLTASLIDIWAL
jgi:hypothetical protein